MSTAPNYLLHNLQLADGTGPGQGGMAIAVTGSKITAIGPDADILQLAGPQTRQIDAKGAKALPGFFESHMHLFAGGATLTQCDLLTSFGEDAVRDAIRAHSQAHPDMPLVCGFSANYTMFGEDIRPDRHSLDRILADRPLFIVAVDGHTGWANTRALDLAGILQGHDIDGEASVEMGQDGLASGELRESDAMNLVARLSATGGREWQGTRGTEPAPVTSEEFEGDLAVLRQALDYCAAHGITKIINMDGNFHQLNLLRELDRRGELHTRIELPYGLSEASRPEDLAGIAARMEEGATEMLTVGRFKMFMDGVFDNWTALVTDEYPDRPGFAAQPIIPPETFNALCTEADRLNWQISVHAVGDGAVRNVLDGYEAARNANGPRDSRHRIEHIDTIRDEDIPRLRELGVTASMQPVHPPGSAGLPLEPTITLMGRARWKNAFAWRRIHDEGVPIAFATDWPISPLDPLFAIQTAMIRKPWAEDVPDQRLTLDECFQAYTERAAYAAFDEDRVGRLEQGMLADLILLEGDLDSLAREGKHEVKCILTMCNGQITHRLEHI